VDDNTTTLRVLSAVLAGLRPDSHIVQLRDGTEVLRPWPWQHALTRRVARWMQLISYFDDSSLPPPAVVFLDR
jgi:hypothetical protein